MTEKESRASTSKISKPSEWGEDKITQFLDMAEGNNYGTFVRFRNGFKCLIEINNIFSEAIEYSKNSKDWRALIFFLKTHSAFLGALRLAMSPNMAEVFMVLRGTLENALYGWYIYKKPELFELWLKRHKSEIHKQKVRDIFITENMFTLLEKDNPKLAQIARRLYDECIDFGAHPNEMSLSTSLKMIETRDEIRLDYNYLIDEPRNIAFCLKSSARVGALCLELMKLIIPHRFEITQLDTRLNNITKAFRL